MVPRVDEPPEARQAVDREGPVGGNDHRRQAVGEGHGTVCFGCHHQVRERLRLVSFPPVSRHVLDASEDSPARAVGEANADAAFGLQGHPGGQITLDLLDREILAPLRTHVDDDVDRRAAVAAADLGDLDARHERVLADLVAVDLAKDRPHLGIGEH